MHRVVVIGCGLFGSAATRYLAEQFDGILCVGPDEPQDKKAHGGVFGSHYDEGRMTRIVDPSIEWGISAKNSINRYSELEKRSGIKFFTPCGYLGIGEPGSDYNDRCAEVAKSFGLGIERLTASEIRAKFPFLSISSENDGLIETDTAGHISPRAMIRAQSKLAEQSGASFVKEMATKITTRSKGIEIQLGSGRNLKTEKVLLATGGFTSACGLSPIELKLRVFGRTTVLARIDEPERTELSSMPTIIHCKSGAYILPPIKYPDGNTYLKLGVGTDADVTFERLEDLCAWFKGAGSEENRLQFTDFIKNLIPALEHCSYWHTDTCVVTQTATGLPITKYVYEDKIAVAVGGNGKGAKGADEWGKIAAGLIAV